MCSIFPKRVLSYNKESLKCQESKTEEAGCQMEVGKEEWPIKSHPPPTESPTRQPHYSNPKYQESLLVFQMLSLKQATRRLNHFLIPTSQVSFTRSASHTGPPVSRQVLITHIAILSL